MCRSIKVLRLPEGQAGELQIREAALQYVRKVSGYRVPSRANRAVFEAAVDEVARATESLLDRLQTKSSSAPPEASESPREG